MCIFEYDEEETLRQLGQQSYEEGVAAGIEQGRTEGSLRPTENRMSDNQAREKRWTIRD